MATATLALVMLIAIWPFSSGTTYKMRAANSVPAATGTVDAQKGSNGNTKLDIKVKNLAQPSSLTPSEEVYIVWVQPNGGEPVKQGAIKVDSNLNGELNVVTTAKSFDVFITAEQSPGVTSPSGAKVLWTHVDI